MADSVVRYQLTAGDGVIEISVMPGESDTELDVSISCPAGGVRT